MSAYIRVARALLSAAICATSINLAAPDVGRAAPYAALVMDARSGKVLHARNADRRLHPASLTKMMTLYVAFEAVERGEIKLDTVVTISKNASKEPPSKLGLRAGQKIKFRYLIRAAAIKSANDAATAIGEAVSGSEAAFARRMTATAKAMGMGNTTFRNAHGLTQSGHLSTARDMATLGRRLFYDHQDYYNLFSRIRTSAGTKTVANTNGRILTQYRGADGIKTGYTNAAGYNLVASARRGNERIIASLFGGKSVGWRTARIKQLLDMGFQRAPSQERVIRPQKIPYIGNAQIASLGKRSKERLPTQIKHAYLPERRPRQDNLPEVDALVARAVLDQEIEDAVAGAVLAASGRDIPSLDRMALPRRRPKPGQKSDSAEPQFDPNKPRVVQVARGAGAKWAVELGIFANRTEAEKLLLVTALQEFSALDGAFRKIETVQNDGRREFRARFVGLTEKDATRACAGLLARKKTCVAVSPGT